MHPDRFIIPGGALADVGGDGASVTVPRPVRPVAPFATEDLTDAELWHAAVNLAEAYGAPDEETRLPLAQAVYQLWRGELADPAVFDRALKAAFRAADALRDPETDSEF